MEPEQLCFHGIRPTVLSRPEAGCLRRAFEPIEGRKTSKADKVHHRLGGPFGQIKRLTEGSLVRGQLWQDVEKDISRRDTARARQPAASGCSCKKPHRADEDVDGSKPAGEQECQQQHPP